MKKKTKMVKIANFVASSPAISEKEKEELEKKTQESENKNQKISSQNLKKSTQKNKEISEISKNVQKKENKNITETKKKLEKFSKTEKICEDWVNVKDGKFGRFQLNYIAHQKCTHGTLYRLENNTYIFHTQYNLYHTHYQNEKPREHFYIYVADLQSWVEFIPKFRENQRDPMPELMAEMIIETVGFFIPLEDGFALILGKDFNGEECNRFLSAGFIIWDLTGGKVTKGAKIIGKAASSVIPDIVKKTGKKAVKESVEKITENLDEISKKILKSGENFTILKKARNLPGVVKGSGYEITGKWLKGTDGNAGLFPKSVADKLRGKTFSNFDKFREAFWKEVANDPHLSKQFKPQNIKRMKEGLAPISNPEQWLGGNKSYILHHKTPINQGGGVYDVDNLYIVTPRYHKEILAPDYHYGYGYK